MAYHLHIDLLTAKGFIRPPIEYPNVINQKTSFDHLSRMSHEQIYAFKGPSLDLLVQTIGPLCPGAGQTKDILFTPIQDSTRRGDMLLINDSCKPDTGVSLAEYLPAGSVILIKTALLSTVLGDVRLRVDYMSQIIRLTEDHELYPKHWTEEQK
jgi:hypothetical protein